MRKTVSFIIFALATLIFAPSVFPHCEIPCGIYDDKARFETLKEHISTIEKSMKNIAELSGAKDKNYNQLVRWVNNKEEHASHIQEIVSQYFMTQRIKPADKNNEAAYKAYLEKINLLHEMLVYAMKTKQTTELAHVEKLRSLVDNFIKIYLKG